MSTILVTGGDSFVGSVLIDELISQGHIIRATSRKPVQCISDINRNIEWKKYDLTDEDTDYATLLDGIDVVIHLAARVHIRGGLAKDQKYFRQANVVATKRLVEATVQNGTGRFIFISTIGVNGNGSALRDTAFTMRYSETTAPQPHNAYSISKYEAEQAVFTVCHSTAIDYVVLRCPLIYGPGVKSSFFQLMDLVARGYPLPFRNINNIRSTIYIDNLTDIIARCVVNPAVSNKLFLVSDYDLSLPEMINHIAGVMGITPKLFALPATLLQVMGRMTNRQEMMNSILNSLLIDNTKLRRALHWQPRVTLDQAFFNTVEWYKQQVS